MFALSLKMFGGDFSKSKTLLLRKLTYLLKNHGWKTILSVWGPVPFQKMWEKNQPWSQVTSGFPGDPSQNPNKKQTESHNLSSFLKGSSSLIRVGSTGRYPSERLGTYSRRVKKMVLISIVGWRRPLCEVWLATRSNFDTPRWSKDIENSRGIQEVYIVNSPHFKHLHSITANLHLFRNWRTPLCSPFFGGPNLFLYSSSKKDSGEKNRGGKILSKL